MRGFPMEDQTLFVNQKIEAVRCGSHVELHYRQPHVTRIDAADRQAVDDEVLRMLRMRTREGVKYVTQEVVGEIIGVSRQMVNRRLQVYRQEGLVALLAGEWEKSKITPALFREACGDCGEKHLLVHSGDQVAAAGGGGVRGRLNRHDCARTQADGRQEADHADAGEGKQAAPRRLHGGGVSDRAVIRDHRRFVSESTNRSEREDRETAPV
jgi:hypothetical protein